MRQIELRTHEDRFVSVVEIIPFPDAGLPEIVAWGERFFMKRGEDEPRPNLSAGRWIYDEGLLVVSFTPAPGLPR